MDNFEIFGPTVDDCCEIGIYHFGPTVHSTRKMNNFQIFGPTVDQNCEVDNFEFFGPTVDNYCEMGIYHFGPTVDNGHFHIFGHTVFISLVILHFVFFRS